MINRNRIMRKTNLNTNLKKTKALDVINTIALNKCTDTTHFIHVQNFDSIQSFTLAELDNKATYVAQHLFSLGVRARDRIGIMARNCIEWVLLDLAILKLGAVTAGFEPGRYDAKQIINDYELKIVFTGEAQTHAQIFNIAIVDRWSKSPPKYASEMPLHVGYDPSDICAIKFTSGSTGIPKGLEATVASINSSLSAVQEMFKHRDGDNILIFLRLSLLQQRYWIYSALVNKHDISISNIDDVLKTAQLTSPTVIMGVPGFYEDVKTRLETANCSLDDLSIRQQAIQTILGERIRYLWTGSAPANHALLKFFNDANIPLYEGYGLNETCIVAKNYPGAFRLGSVGKILPNKAVRFDKNGILIVSSSHPINCRYSWCTHGANEKTFLPTAEVKTFDLGHIDADGFLYIYGRVDDIITLSNGRNILASLIEEKLREHPAVQECVLFGNGKPFLTAIISPTSSNIDHHSLDIHIKTLNKSLLPEQHIHSIVLTSEKFSIENNLLTSQFKPVRQEIYRRYAAELAAIYEKPHIT